MSPEDEAREVAFNYVDLIAQNRPDRLGEVFTSDGIWMVPERDPIRGLPAITAAMTEMLALWDGVFQYSHGGHVRVDGDVIRGRWHWGELGRLKGEGDVSVIGLYDDLMRRTDAGWRFAVRRVTVLYRGEVPPGGTFFPPAPSWPSVAELEAIAAGGGASGGQPSN